MIIDTSKEYWIGEIEQATKEEIMMNTPDCVIYKMEKDNCRGCRYELNCAKLSHILSVVNSMTSYKPADFMDHLKTERTAAGIIDNIMNAKSVEQIEEIMKGGYSYA